MQTASDAEVVKTNHAFNVAKGCYKLVYVHLRYALRVVTQL